MSETGTWPLALQNVLALGEVTALQSCLSHLTLHAAQILLLFWVTESLPQGYYLLVSSWAIGTADRT